MWCTYSFYIYVWILTFLIAELVICQARIEGGWNSSPNTQYHIQTDEGDERYFRYQTLTGQYRKEKRLQDGSVVGTYGWVDADGYLRLKDYVADDQGYRIVRSKKLFVGGSTPIDQAVYSSKYAPSQVIPNAAEYNPYVHAVDNSISSTTTSYPTPSTPMPLKQAAYSVPNYNNVVSSTEAPYVSHSYSPVTDNTISSTEPVYKPDTYDSYLLSRAQSYDEKPLEFPGDPIALSDYVHAGSEQVEREVAITPHYRYSISTTPTPPPPVYETSTLVPQAYYSSSSAPKAYYSSASQAYESSTPTPQAYYSSAPQAYESSTPPPQAYYSSTSGPKSYYSSAPQAYQSSTPAPQEYYSSTSAPKTYYSSTPQVYESSTTAPKVYETSTPAPKPVTFRPYYRPNALSSEFNIQDSSKKLSEYDGVSLTHNGFKYYLPKQYHEEEGTSSSHRAGSFGYVDPFGIRRVIYYNTSPEKGFVHRKNNRYVGFDAPPYDPRF